MPTSAAGNRRRAPGAARARPAWGFTLLELMVVVAIGALAAGAVVLAVRDPAQMQLTREAERLAARLEAARAVARASGSPVRWRPEGGGFRFDGLPGARGEAWLSPATRVAAGSELMLGPEPLIGPQAVVLTSAETPGLRVRVATDGLRPFQVGGS